jgi:hypothetical protein
LKTLSKPERFSLKTPPEKVLGLVKRLRAIHTFNRLLSILTIALAVDLVLDLSTYTLFTLFRWKLALPHFFEIFIIILIARELPRLNMERFCTVLDRRFALKDRLYSLYWFSIPGNADSGILTTHTSECLSAIDFEEVGKKLRVQMPPLLPLVGFLFIILIYMGWNAEYRPPGITSRIFIETIRPFDQEQVEKHREDLATREREEDELAGKITDDKMADVLFPVEREMGEEEGDPTLPDNGEAQGGSGDRELYPSGSGPGGQEGTGSPGQVDLVAPQTIESITVTDKVSAPEPLRLEPGAKTEFSSLPEAREFLSLIPGQEGKKIADLDSPTIENYRALIEDYPPVYRKQLETYYRELMKWEKRK